MIVNQLKFKFPRSLTAAAHQVIGLSLVFDTSCTAKAGAAAAPVPALGAPLLGNGASGFTVQDDSVAAEPAPAAAAAAPKLREGESPAVYGELNIWQTMGTLDCWLMVFCTFATMASNGNPKGLLT